MNLFVKIQTKKDKNIDKIEMRKANSIKTSKDVVLIQIIDSWSMKVWAWFYEGIANSFTLQDHI